MFPELKIGEFTARIPIIQGGMGVGISMSGLAAATANEGGIGVISSVALGLLEKLDRKSYRKENLVCLRKEIRKAKAMSDGVIGLNVMVAVSDYDDIVKAAIEEEIDILFLGAGLCRTASLIQLKHDEEIDAFRRSRIKCMGNAMVTFAAGISLATYLIVFIPKISVLV